MKLITIAVPCYNSQDYLHTCLDSLVKSGTEVEVIVVNDGSTDNTQTIAKEYEKKYPNIVRVVSKMNGGHGSAVNEGLKHATGLFYKVVDSDDWLDELAFNQLLDTIRKHYEEKTLADLYICNFIYDKVLENRSYVRSFKKHFKTERFLSWKEVKTFYGSQVLLMHSLIYNTDLLRQSNTHLPSHTFYVDNIFAYKPLPYMHKIYYLNIDLYHYFIGREDQSVNIKVFTQRYDQQIRVMKEMVMAYSYNEITRFEKGLKKYMFHCLGAIMVITILFTVAKDDNERRENLQELWCFIKNRDAKLYRLLRLRSLPAIVNYLPWRLRGAIMIMVYKHLRRRLKLG
ncbi:MAG: glycosyltransferase family A protein [Candidatus Izemoplasmatales bacterium]